MLTLPTCDSLSHRDNYLFVGFCVCVNTDSTHEVVVCTLRAGLLEVWQGIPPARAPGTIFLSVYRESGPPTKHQQLLHSDELVHNICVVVCVLGMLCSRVLWTYVFLRVGMSIL